MRPRGDVAAVITMSIAASGERRTCHAPKIASSSRIFFAIPEGIENSPRACASFAAVICVVSHEYAAGDERMRTRAKTLAWRAAADYDPLSRRPTVGKVGKLRLAARAFASSAACRLRGWR